LKNLLKIFLLGFYAFTSGCIAQAPAHVSVNSEKFNNRLELLLDFSVPVMDVGELYKNKENYLVLDAREPEEFEVSHIENAKFIGYDHPNFEVLENMPKDQPIVLYCSIGYRSEKLAKKLQKRGFTNVSNLYGSIFEWTNDGYPLVDENGAKTDTVHTFNKFWSKWVEEGKAEKVW